MTAHKKKPPGGLAHLSHSCHTPFMCIIQVIKEKSIKSLISIMYKTEYSAAKNSQTQVELTVYLCSGQLWLKT